MLGEDFELEFSDGTLWIDAGSGEELWELVSRLVAAGDGAREQARQPRAAEDFHRGFVELYEGYRDGDRIRAPRRYLLTLGTRR